MLQEFVAAWARSFSIEYIAILNDLCACAFKSQRNSKISSSQRKPARLLWLAVALVDETVLFSPQGYRGGSRGAELPG